MRLIKDPRPQSVFRTTPLSLLTQSEGQLPYSDFLTGLDELRTILLLLSEYTSVQLDIELLTLDAVAEIYFRRAWQLLI